MTAKASFNQRVNVLEIVIQNGWFPTHKIIDKSYSVARNKDEFFSQIRIGFHETAPQNPQAERNINQNRRGYAIGPEIGTMRDERNDQSN